MHVTRMLIAGLIVLSTVGCQTHKPPPPDRDFKPKGPVRTGDRELYSGMVQDYYRRQSDGAIVREQTLYPYHFVVNGSSLNALGKREMSVLINHYMLNPGNLNVRHGEESKETYEARVKTVVTMLTDAGIRMDRVEVTDGLPGGDGVTSDRVVLIMERFQKPGGLAEGSGGSSKTSSGTDADSNTNSKDTGTGSAGSSNSGSSMSNTGGY